MDPPNLKSLLNPLGSDSTSSASGEQVQLNKEIPTMIPSLGSGNQSETKQVTVGALQGNSSVNLNQSHIYTAGGNITVNAKDDLETIRNWIRAPDPSTNFNYAYDNMMKGTGHWLLEEEKFRKWKQNGKLLWLQGKSGAGKTFLCTTVIHSLKHTENLEGVVYYYFDSRHHAKETFEGLISSLLSQIGSHYNHGHIYMLQLYQRNECGLYRPSSNDMKTALLDVLKSNSSVTYVVIDAMDECNSSDKNKTFSFIEELLNLDNVFILVTSRNEAGSPYVSNKGPVFQLSIKAKHIKEDLSVYVSFQLAKHKNLQSSMKLEVENALIAGSDGQFRWVDCQLMELKTLTQPKKIRKALTELPKTLEDTYRRALEKVKEQYTEDAQHLLQWLMFSYEPLTLPWLQEILAVDLDTKSFSAEDRYRGPVHDIIDTTLVTVSSGEEQIIQLAHLSVKEYLISKNIEAHSARIFHVDAWLAHDFIAQTCIIYLLHCENGVTRETYRTKMPLAVYAAKYWTRHVQCLGNRGSKANELAIRLLDNRGDSYFRWLGLYDPDDVWRRREPFPQPIYYAARTEMLTVVKALVAKGEDVNAKGGKYGYALQATAVQENMEIFQLLLDKGADVNALGGYYGSALIAAAINENMKMMELMLDKGADVNAQGSEYGNALIAAAVKRNVEMAQLLLDKGADVNALGGNHGSALTAAVVNENMEIFQLLLDKGADVNAPGGYYGSALIAAAINENMEMMELMLDKGADVNAQGSEYGNALIGAAVKRNMEMAQLLLDKGIDVNAPGGNYGSALIAAAVNENIEMIQLLLDKGADVNAQGGDYGSALQAAAVNGNMEIFQLLLDRGTNARGYYGNVLMAAVVERNMEMVQLLLDKGADVNAQGGDYGSALIAAADNGNMKIIQLLLDRGADVNAQGGNYGNALQAAADHGNIEIAQLLLDKGADVNAQGGCYGNALMAAAVQGNMNIAQLLLDKGADVNAQGGYHRNALMAAVMWGNVEIVKLLLDKGAHANAQGGHYTNALMAAAVKGNIKMVQLLLDKDADVNAQGGYHGSALQATAFEGSMEIAQLLLDKDADVNAQGGYYGSALQAAAVEGNMKVMQLLLDKGADINAQGGYYGNALQAATQMEHTHVVQLLLASGAINHS